ncbi:MAG: helix-turn-helix domain-containing protein [Acidobacteria bacterium]|nr:helix-turn-helix domain-containing protein [Acidobacteriota bacterium]
MASFGEELRRERELRDISIREISEATNIPSRFLEALEQNNFSILPGGAYNRGFIRSYARHIGINIEEMINAYSQEVGRQEANPPIDARRSALPPGAQASNGAAGLIAGISVLAVAGAIAILYYFAGAALRRTPAPESPAVAHGVALKARVKKSGALPSEPGATRPEPPPDAAKAVAGSAAPEIPAAAPGVERLVKVRALETTWVQLTCAGVAQFRGDLWVGSERHFPCREPVVLSADNGGAIECAVDGAEVQLLGDRGEIVRDRPIPIQRPPAPAADPAVKAKPRPAAATPAEAPGRIS